MKMSVMSTSLSLKRVYNNAGIISEDMHVAWICVSQFLVINTQKGRQTWNSTLMCTAQNHITLVAYTLRGIHCEQNQRVGCHVNRKHT